MLVINKAGIPQPQVPFLPCAFGNTIFSLVFVRLSEEDLKFSTPAIRALCVRSCATSTKITEAISCMLQKADIFETQKDVVHSTATAWNARQGGQQILSHLSGMGKINTYRRLPKQTLFQLSTMCKLKVVYPPFFTLQDILLQFGMSYVPNKRQVLT